MNDSPMEPHSFSIGLQRRRRRRKNPGAKPQMISRTSARPHSNSCICATVSHASVQHKSREPAIRGGPHPTLQSSPVCRWHALFVHRWFGASCGCGWHSRNVSAVAPGKIENLRLPPEAQGLTGQTDPTTAPGSARRRNYSSKSLLVRRFPCSQQQQSYRRSV
jgi:hypothetical protein